VLKIVDLSGGGIMWIPYWTDPYATIPLNRMTIFAETERLILREILPTDVEGIYELDSDVEVQRYLGNNPLTDKTQAEEVIRHIRQQYADHGIGRWAVIDKNTNQFMGWSGLKWITEPMNGRIHFHDLGYRLIRKYWGHGFATESAIATLSYGFNTLKLKDIYAAAHVENLGSNKIIQKLGFQFEETFIFYEALHNWYRIREDGWREGER